jgi:hypothetical protein
VQKCPPRVGGWGQAGGIKGRAPAPLPVQGRKKGSVLRAPDERVDVRVGLARGTAKVSVDRFRTELGRRDRERDVILAGGLALAYPAGADLGALRHNGDGAPDNGEGGVSLCGSLAKNAIRPDLPPNP